MTVIDLEQRRWSNKYAIAKLILWQEEQLVKEQMDQHRKLTQQSKRKDPVEKELISKIEKFLRNKQNSLRVAKDVFCKKEVPQAKVEYRPLKKGGKEGAPQGVIELFVDVLDVEEARITQW